MYSQVEEKVSGKREVTGKSINLQELIGDGTISESWGVFDFSL